MNGNPTKNRIFYILRYLHDHTDEQHQVSTFQMLDYLEGEGIKTDRKTLRSDIDILIANGFDVVITSGRPNRYFLGTRLFELPELRLLVDAVSSSRFISAKKSTSLVERLGSLASDSQRETLKRHIYATNPVKTENENVYYTVDTLNEAINNKRKITFKYMDYTPEKEMILRGHGEVYVLSPYALYWNDDFYYAVGWSDKHENVSSFRVDRMYEPKISDERIVKPPYYFNIDNYARKIFEMYDGEKVTVELECENDLMKYIIDRFGKKVMTRVNSSSTFIATVEVALSPTFYSWLFTFAGRIRILSPEFAANEYKVMAKRVIEK